jgi:hypothetical protein
MVTSLTVIGVLPAAVPGAPGTLVAHLFLRQQAEPAGPALLSGMAAWSFYDFKGTFPFFLEVITRAIKLAEL